MTGTETARGLRVLIVEDNRDAATSLALLLGLWGHEPVVALDGRAGLAAAAERHDVILLDLGLPGLDGLEVARALRREWPYKPPVLIAVTGHGSTDDRR